MDNLVCFITVVIFGKHVINYCHQITFLAVYSLEKACIFFGIFGKCNVARKERGHVSVTKCHKGKGSKIGKKKCRVLFKWPFIFSIAPDR